MAIYTRFGDLVTLISAQQDNQGYWLTVRFEDGTTREYAAYEFRADGGWTEIKTAIDALGKPVNVCAFETGLNYGCEQAPAASEPTQEAAAVEPDAYHRLAIAMGVAPDPDEDMTHAYIEAETEHYAPYFMQQMSAELDTLRAENARLRAALEAIVAMSPRTMSQSLSENYAFGYNMALEHTQKVAREALNATKGGNHDQ